METFLHLLNKFHYFFIIIKKKSNGKPKKCSNSIKNEMLFSLAFYQIDFDSSRYRQYYGLHTIIYYFVDISSFRSLTVIIGNIFRIFHFGYTVNACQLDQGLWPSYLVIGPVLFFRFSPIFGIKPTGPII